RPLAYHALSLSVGPEIQFTLARRLAQGFSVQAPMSLQASMAQTPARRRPGQRIRIGYVSPDFRIHPVGLLMEDAFRLHDRSRFEVFAYSLVPDDESDVRRCIAAGVDCYRVAADWPEGTIAAQIAADGIDILVDLAGYTDGARPGVFARRPSAVQV